MVAKVIGRTMLALASLMLAASMAYAQNVRVRGTIEKVEPTSIAVKTREGENLTIKLGDNLAVIGVVKQTMADIKPNSFVGIAALAQGDGTMKALEVLIFPENMRGAGEGHYPWDLAPQSTMTNAAVTDIVTKADGTTLTLKYKDGEKAIVVPPDTPIVSFVPGDRSELKPGAKIFIGGAPKQPDGSLLAARIAVGRDGLTPPM